MICYIKMDKYCKHMCFFIRYLILKFIFFIFQLLFIFNSVLVPGVQQSG